MSVDPSPHTAGPASLPGGAVARRTRPIYRVFVSSTWVDLQPERRALMEALNRMEEMRFVGMEFFGNRPDDTHDASIDQVDLCEVFVGIIGHRYGSGITEAEYRRARALNLPCFVYFKREETLRPELTDNDPALAAKLVTFKQDLLRGHTVKEFASAEELAASATADLHNWVAARWITMEPAEPAATRSARQPADADRTNVLRLLDRIDQDWIKGVLEASLHHRAWLELGLDWREDAVEHPWDRIVVAANRPIQTLSKGDSIAGVFDAAQHTLLVLGEPGAGKTTTVLELARDLIARAKRSPTEPVPVVLALSTWRGQHKDLLGWLVAELGLRYQVPKRVARTWLEDGRLVLILDGLDEVISARRLACVAAINAFEEAHPPAGLTVTCRVAEYNALTTKLRLRSAICLQPLTERQVDRYFEAAGPALEPLRRALQTDAGLRELARSPLMLSVMTMALNSVPQETLAPFAAAQTPEELRRRLFDAYVKGALQRRGKANAGFTPEQTTKWLTWLARRMKENGHTLFTLEQLQPGWLEGGWRQFGYFLLSRLLGGISVLLPFLATVQSRRASETIALAVLAMITGSYLAVIDFAIARHGWGGPHRGITRFWLLLAGLLLLTFAWLGLVPGRLADGGAGAMYLIVFGLAFCAPLDVRGLDIKPAGSIQWSRSQAYLRWLQAMAALSVLVTATMLLNTVNVIRDHGWAQGWINCGGAAYLAGLVFGGAMTWFGWQRWRFARTPGNLAMAIALVLAAGELGAGLGRLAGAPPGYWEWYALPGQAMPAMLFAVFGGFGATLIDPERPQRTGFWFWLRVPLMAFLSVGLLVFAPGLFVVGGFLVGGQTREAWSALSGIGLFSLACGLIAFLRFGGFNGVQHFLLRWLLARTGSLPPKPEQFLNYAGQIALMQKVGLGFRFVHALLLQHFSRGWDSADESSLYSAAAEGSSGASEVDWSGSWARNAAASGLVVGGLLIVWLGATSVALGLGGLVKASGVMPLILGTLMALLAAAIPLLLLTGRRLGRLAWRWLGAGWIALAILFVWLAWDEPALQYPNGLPGSAERSAGQAHSHAVLIRYGQSGFGRFQPAAKSFKWPALNFSQAPEQGDIWRDFIVSHRAAIEANWASLSPVRAWMEELNAFDNFADLTDDLVESASIAYPVRRTYVQNVCAMAGLLALDRRGDDALELLRPLVEVGGKLEVAARTRGYYNDARSMQAAAIRTAAFVLDQAPVSPVARARFATALGLGGGSAGARRPFAITYALIAQTSGTFGSALAIGEGGGFDLLRPALDLVGPVIYNHRTVLNHWGSLLADLQACAARRDSAEAARRLEEFYAVQTRPRLKNVGETWTVWLVADYLGFGRGTERQKSYWDVEDRRTALIARLTQH